jgi:hypothetical protein
MPWATSESTGLPEIPMASNHPWIMEPGTHRAHYDFALTEEKVALMRISHRRYY